MILTKERRMGSPFLINEVSTEVKTPRLLKAHFQIEKGPLLELGGIRGLSDRVSLLLLPVLEASTVGDASLVEPTGDESGIPLTCRLAFEAQRQVIIIQESSPVQLNEDGDWQMSKINPVVRPSLTARPRKRVHLWNPHNQDAAPYTWTGIKSNYQLDSSWRLEHQGFPVIIKGGSSQRPSSKDDLSIILPGTSKRSSVSFRARALEKLREGKFTFQDAFFFWWDNYFTAAPINLEVWVPDGSNEKKIFGAYSEWSIFDLIAP